MPEALNPDSFLLLLQDPSFEIVLEPQNVSFPDASLALAVVNDRLLTFAFRRVRATVA